jgi:hypothetical protein
MWQDMGGTLHIYMQNAGTVPLIGWDLAVRLERASTSENLGTYIFSGVALEPGAATELTRPEWILGPAADIIATLDPDNALPEANEGNNTYAGGDFVAYMGALVTPPAHERTFALTYHYASNHGDPIQIRVTPLHLGAPVSGLSPVSVTVPHGGGPSPVHVIYTGPARAYTDQLRVEMVDGGGVAFYGKVIDTRLVWEP